MPESYRNAFLGGVLSKSADMRSAHACAVQTRFLSCHADTISNKLRPWRPSNAHRKNDDQAVQNQVQNMTLGAQAHPKVIQMGFQREPLGAPKAPSGAQGSPMEYQRVPKAPVTVKISGPASPHGLHYGRPAPKSWRSDNLWHRVMWVFGG